MADKTPRKSLEDLLGEQVEADSARAERARELEKLSVEQAILFTDIVGSTEFFEKHGDVAGMTLLKRHDSLLHPVVTANHGRIVKTIGDAIMAAFENPLDAVRCGVQMQKILRTERERRPDEPLHIRIGVHYGKCFSKGEDFFGDTVNTSARINHEAQKDEVLLSKSLWDLVPSSEGLRGVPRGALALKGKAEPVPVVGIPFASADEGVVPSAEVALDYRATPSTAPELFVLEIARGARGLKVSVIDGAQDKGTVKAYEEQAVAPAELDALAKSFEAFMTAGAADSYRARVAERGRELFTRALSDRARRRITATSLQFMRLNLDDELVHVPWELMHDGRDFLALRFAVGRVVAARSDDAPPARLPRGTTGGHVLVVSNATGDLPAAASEGTAVAGLLRDGYAGEVRHLEGPVTRDAFFKALRGCRLLHFAGHSQASQGAVKGGFALSDGVATPEEVVKACGATAPMLVFANSCSSSTRLGWTETAERSFNLASALLMRGSQHFIGPLWDVPDEDALAFALRFYERALSGIAFGEAVRLARNNIAMSGRHPLSFAGYVLYGQPRTAFHPSTVKLAAAEKMRSGSEASLPLGRVAAAAASAFSGATADRPSRPSGQIPDVMRSSAPWAKWARRFLVVGTVAGVLGRGAVGLFEFVSAGKAISTAKLSPTPGATAAPAAGGTGRSGGAASPVTTQVAMVGSATRHDGPVRVTILPFKNLSDDRSFDVGGSMQEAVLTGTTGVDGVMLLEQGQADAQQHYAFDETWARKWILDGKEIPAFDRTQLAALGKFEGAEVVVLGAYQKSGRALRANARLVNTETGEILATVKVDRPDGNTLKLEDALADETKKAIASAKSKMRPSKPL